MLLTTDISSMQLYSLNFYHLPLLPHPTFHQSFCHTNTVSLIGCLPLTWLDIVFLFHLHSSALVGANKQEKCKHEWSADPHGNIFSEHSNIMMPLELVSPQNTPKYGLNIISGMVSLYTKPPPSSANPLSAALTKEKTSLCLMKCGMDGYHRQMKHLRTIQIISLIKVP